MSTFCVSKKLRNIGLSLLTAASLASVATPRAAHAAQALRFSVNTHGDMTVFGNTLSQDCRPGIPAPVVGTVGSCGANTVDSAPDVFWRADQPAAGQALADTAISAASSRSTAMLSLPAGAVVLYARLYWAAQVAAGTMPQSSVLIERPGSALVKMVATDSVRGISSLDSRGYRYYQGTADITAEVQANGAGAYRVTGVDSISLTNLNESVAFSNWNVVVLYRLPTEPTRNLAVFDGLDEIAGTAASVTINGFLVPSAGFDAKMAVQAYEGDFDITGDQLLFNNVAQSNALNPADNFFNATRTVKGQPVSSVGDLPQLTGTAGSRAYDLDLIDVTSQLKAGDTSAQISATTSGDVYYLGGLFTSISTLMPVFDETTKTYVNLSRSDGTIVPGDLIEYTITTKNSGTDSGSNVILRDPLPSTLIYEPGSIEVLSGQNLGKKTDVVADDVGEFDAVTSSIVVRLGAGATGTTGGVLKVGESASVKFRARVKSGAVGVLKNQALVSSQGVIAVSQGLTSVSSWQSGDGKNPTVPTTFLVDQCNATVLCPLSAPVCSSAMAGLPRVCSTGTVGPDVYLAEKTSPLNPDGTVTMTFTVGNNGPGTAPGASFSYTVPPGVDPATVKVDAGAGWTCGMSPASASGGTMITCTTDTPIVKGMAAPDVRITLPPVLNGSPLPIKGTAQGRDPATGQPLADPTPANNTVDTSIPLGGPDLYLIVADPVEKNPETGAVTYTVSVGNKGSVDSPGAAFTYQLPPGLDPQQVSVVPGDGWTCQVVDRLLSCTTSSPVLAMGESTPVKLTVTPNSTDTSVPFKASVSGLDKSGNPIFDPDLSNNSVAFDTAVDLAKYKLEGGGFTGCSMNSQRSSTASGLAMALVGMSLVLVRRRRQPLFR